MTLLQSFGAVLAVLAVLLIWLIGWVMLFAPDSAMPARVVGVCLIVVVLTLAVWTASKIIA